MSQKKGAAAGADQTAAEAENQADDSVAEWAELEAEAAADAERQASAPAGASDQAAGQVEEYAKDPQVERAVHQLLEIGFGTLAPAWNVQRQEIDAMADAYARSLEDIFPGGAAALGPHFASILITLAVVGPRVAQRVPPKIEEPESGGDQAPAEEAGKGAGDAES